MDPAGIRNERDFISAMTTISIQTPKSQDIGKKMMRSMMFLRKSWKSIGKAKKRLMREARMCGRSEG